MSRVDRIKKLGTREGFIDLVLKDKRQGETQTDTFHRINAEYEQVFNKPKYSDYKSFSNQKSKVLKQK